MERSRIEDCRTDTPVASTALAKKPGTDRFAAGEAVGYTAAERLARARANRETGSAFTPARVNSAPWRAFFCSPARFSILRLSLTIARLSYFFDFRPVTTA